MSNQNPTLEQAERAIMGEVEKLTLPHLSGLFYNNPLGFAERRGLYSLMQVVSDFRFRDVATFPEVKQLQALLSQPINPDNKEQTEQAANALNAIRQVQVQTRQEDDAAYFAACEAFAKRLAEALEVRRVAESRDPVTLEVLLTLDVLEWNLIYAALTKLDGGAKNV
jgi:hypothetical protein